MPALQQVATPAFRDAIARRSSAPSRCSSSSAPTRPTSSAGSRDFGQGAANYDANGHYARIQPIFNAFNFTDNPAGGVLTADPAGAAHGRPARPACSRRCPGARVPAARRRLGALRRHGDVGLRLRSEPRAARP